MIETMLSSPLFGLAISCLAWWAGLWIQKKTGLLLCNPLVVATALIILFLTVFHIPHADYDRGGALISLFLGPATAVLALNIYRQRQLLKAHFLPVLAGCLAGCLTSVGSVLLLCRLMAVETEIAASLLPKSVTTAIAVAIADSGGGIRSIAAAAVIAAGLTGALFSPLFARLFRVTDPIAQGVGIGASSHALGTSRALEIGPLQGAMSSVSLCVCGIITSVLALFL